MRRFLCCLGVCGLLAGASLVLPVVASAQVSLPTCGRLANGDWFISESSNFNTNIEQYECVVPLTFGPANLFDLLEPAGSSIVSDNVHVTVASGSPSTVILGSDFNEGGLTPTPGARPVVETPCPSTIYSGGEPCDGAELTLTDAVGNTQATLFVMSDTPTSFGGNEVPEPSTGLVLGAALPMLLGLRRRFSTRVSA